MSTLSYTKFSKPSSPIQISNFSIIYNLFDEVNDKLNSNLLGAKVSMNEIKLSYIITEELNLSKLIELAKEIKHIEILTHNNEQKQIDMCKYYDLTLKDYKIKFNTNANKLLSIKFIFSMGPQHLKM